MPTKCPHLIIMSHLQVGTHADYVVYFIGQLGMVVKLLVLLCHQNISGYKNPSFQHESEPPSISSVIVIGRAAAAGRGLFHAAHLPVASSSSPCKQVSI